MSEGYIGPPDNTYISEEWLSEEASTFSFLNKLRFFFKKSVGKEVKAYVQRKEKGTLCFVALTLKLEQHGEDARGPVQARHTHLLSVLSFLHRLLYSCEFTNFQ